MCGIVAVVRRPSSGGVPSPEEIVRLLEGAVGALPAERGPSALSDGLGRTAEHLETVARLLAGPPGVRSLAAAPESVPRYTSTLDDVDAYVDRLEAELDVGAVAASPERLEGVNASLVRVKDAAWALRNDRIGCAFGAIDLAGGPDASPSALEACWSIQVALSALERLEVRGRDSAGLHVLVRDHGLDLEADSVRKMLAARSDALFRSTAVRAPDGHLSFVYKAAAETGELGDNIRVLRAAIHDDALLRKAIEAPTARVLVLGHTRWASVGMISEANAHPVTSEEAGRADAPYVVAALNGDVDNHADLRDAERLDVPPEITTDAKVIPVLVSRRLEVGSVPEEAFRQTVASLDGSVAIAASTGRAPDRLFCALRGSGQALYVGLAPDAFVVTSEPYGLVEQADAYLRMDGELPAAPGDPSTRGQIVILGEQDAGSVEGIHRIAYNGTPLPVRSDELVTPEITTRDIDRGSYPHFLLKEISEAPTSFRKTLRGKIADGPDGPRVVLGADTLPAHLVHRLGSEEIRRVIVIGQGTAAVAGHSLAALLTRLLRATPVSVEAMAATELSGFHLRERMSDTLVVAISQSGTTTDTNRTVELVRMRGAAVIAIVNRRGSDLTDRSDGVLYTSDGRDVEMAVPSTKAFYAQVAAGSLLAFALAEHLGATDPPDRAEILEALRALPAQMEAVLERRSHAAALARTHAPSRRYWAVVGNGLNRVAAEEVRIKLSELCYKSIACDVTEDKKHIDLSAEPLVIVCAAGLTGSNAEDVVKEVAIYRAHKGAPIVIADEGEPRFEALPDVIPVPPSHPDLAFVLSAMAGHLFGYEAALVIDGQATPLREARTAIEAFAATPVEADPLEVLRPTLEAPARRFFEGLRAGQFNGQLEASTAVRLASLFRYAVGLTPLDAYQIEYGTVGTPGTVLEELARVLSEAIDELTRPIDAIRHQAKTVTVGISRAEETLLQVGLVRRVLDAGVSRDGLAYRTIRTLAALDPSVAEVTGHTLYRIEGDPTSDDAAVQVVDREGVARDIPSRTESDPRLKGTKHRVATERETLITRGRSDGRTLIIVPVVKAGEVTGLALLHVRFHDRLPAATMRRVLEGYRDRYAALRDLVTETEPAFRDELLEEVPVDELLISSIQVLADRWRGEGSSAQ